MADEKIKENVYTLESYDFNDDNSYNKIEKSLTPENIKQGSEYSGEWLHKLYNQYNLSSLVDDSPILPQCISAYSRNIAGFGISLKYKEDFQEETPEMKAEWTKAEEILNLMSFDCPLKSVFENIITDRETVGVAYLEVIRNGAGEVVQVEHIRLPHSVEASVEQNDYTEYIFNYKGSAKVFRKKFRRYRQMVDGKTVYFKEFGDPRTMDKTDGNYKDNIDINLEANEILEFKIGSMPYGKVRWLGQTLSVDGARRAEVLNNNYFRKGRHTPLMIIIKGGKLTDGSKKKLREYVNELQGEKAQHGFLVLEAENQDSIPGMTDDKKPEIEIKDLSPILQKDELFQDYIENNRKKCQSAFLLPDLYTAYTTDFNRATAQTAMEVTEKQVFQPERQSIAWIINNKLLNGYGFKYVEVELNAPDITNPDDIAKILGVTSAAGGLTMNDARDLTLETLGRTAEPYPDEIGNLPVSFVQAKSAMAENMESAIEKAEKANERIGKMSDGKAAFTEGKSSDDEVVVVMKEILKALKAE